MNTRYSVCRKLPADTRQDGESLASFCLTLADAGYVTLSPALLACFLLGGWVDGCLW